MPGPAPTDFHSDPVLPRHVDVVVIGGGIIGASTALELAERGVSVLLCEKGRIGAEQSSRNWGWVRLGMRDPREIPLMIESLRLWQALEARIGRSVGYRQSGILFGLASSRHCAQHARWADHLRGSGAEARMISGQDLADLLPGLRMRLAGGLHMPGDGRAEPQLAAPAIAEAARDRGAAVLTHCAVRSLDIQSGRVAGVVTERGRVSCSTVVLAAGAWSRLFAGNAGVALLQLKVLNTVMRTSPASGPETALWSDRFAFRKRADGGYTVASGHENTVDLVPDSFRLARPFFPALRQDRRALRFRISGRWMEEARQARTWQPTDATPFEDCRILDPAPDLRTLRKVWSEARRALPALATAEIVQSWAGMIDVTPDAIPVISDVEQIPGLVIATGFSGHGFGIGPGAGRLAADLVTGATPLVDPGAFRLSRFFDGSRVRPDPGY